MDDAALASEVTELYAAVYLRFHRRRRPGTARTTAQQWSVLTHLAMSGPLTIGECAKHLERAQSVVSEIVDGLETRGLLDRVRDTRDRRRVLVWLTDEALAFLERERQVLDVALLARAAATLQSREKDALLLGLRALVRAAKPLGSKKGSP